MTRSTFAKAAPGTPLEERFWPRVAVGAPDECWPWQSAVAANGYAYFSCGIRPNQVTKPVHCIAYELSVGPVPDGRELDHTCRNPICCNPAHLEPVTHLENMRRSFAAVGHHNARKTHCKRGHLYDEANTRVSNGKRFCRACARLSDTQRRARKKVAL